MARPQVEEGFIQIASGKDSNDILMALVKANLNGTEWEVVVTVIRKTWGFKKKSDWISYSQFINYSSKSRFAIYKAIKSLVNKRILVQKTILGKKSLYQVNKDFDTWKLVNKRILVNKSLLVNKRQHTSKQTSTQLVNKSLHTKDTTTKDNIQKIILPKGNTESYGNENVNKIIFYLKEKLFLPKLDASDKVNRQYAWLLLKKHNGLDGVLELINLASKDDWYKNNISSTRDLYYQGIKLIARKRGEQHGRVAVL